MKPNSEVETVRKEFDEEWRTKVFYDWLNEDIETLQEWILDKIDQAITQTKHEKNTEFAQKLTKLNDFMYSLMEETPIEVRMGLHELITQYSKHTEEVQGE